MLTYAPGRLVLPFVEMEKTVGRANLGKGYEDFYLGQFN